MFKKGIVLSAVFPDIKSDYGQLVQALGRIAASGLFSGVEFYFTGSDEEYRKIGGILQESHLYNVFLPGFEMKRDCLDLGSDSEAIRLHAIKKCREFVRTAYLMHARKMLILSGPKPADGDIGAYLDRFICSLEAVLAYSKSQAAAYSLEVTLEFFNDVGEPWLAIGNVHAVQKICEPLCTRFDNFGITFDTSHVAQLRGDLAVYYAALAPYVHHLHLANCVTRDPLDPLFGDKHPVFNLAQGDFSDDDMADFVNHVKKGRYFEGIDICSYEIIPQGEMHSDASFQSLLASASCIWAKTGG